MIPVRNRTPFDVTAEKTPTLFSEATPGDTLPTRWTPVYFGVVCLIGQNAQRDANMRKLESDSNARVRQLHNDFAAAQLAAMRRDPGKSQAGRLELVQTTTRPPRPVIDAGEEAALEVYLEPYQGRDAADRPR